jgi:anti-anti-sigma factor
MSMSQLRVSTDGGVVIATVAGEIDMSNAAELAGAIRTRISNHNLGLVLDLQAVAYLDSAAIHAIFELREQLHHRGQELRLVLPDPGAALALTLAGVPDVIPVAVTPEAARDEIAGGAGR